MNPKNYVDIKCVFYWYECRILTTLLLNVLLIFMVHWHVGMLARVLIDFSVSEGCRHVGTLAHCLLNSLKYLEIIL